ncbi:GNAT family N-acetyltransferase [Labilibacter marinus]|uniref:GNAT family N-acetyltransferase n=1 Tax=Labilibacter marinus TaxID=1477105 RepID=UPI00095006E9|nr:GNAT family N-acetyltransferase [Labilibacter marinus]
MEGFIKLDKTNIKDEHISCAFSDKKCKESYELKKAWLSEQFEFGYTFRKLDERAKVFIEYGPSEHAWVPIKANNYLVINCFWVSGKYKKNGYGKELLSLALQDAEAQGKDGLITVVGTKKFHFMSDTKWLIKQGFEIIEELPTGFSLLVKKIKNNENTPCFNNSVKSITTVNKEGIVVYYSNRCPFSEYHVHNSLKETANKRNIPLEVVKLETIEEAQNAPTPATIFSLFYEGEFITTDISICMDSRFDKLLAKSLEK